MIELSLNATRDIFGAEDVKEMLRGEVGKFKGLVDAGELREGEDGGDVGMIE